MSAVNLNEFYNKLTNGLRLTHQYQIAFVNIPSGARADKDLHRSITYWAEGFTLPSITQETDKVSYLGYELVIPTKLTMDQQFSLNIRCDNDMQLHDTMLRWQSLSSKAILPDGTLGNMGGHKGIKPAELILELYDHQMEKVQHTYVLKGILPTKVGTINFANGNATVATFDCEFAFQYWYKKGLAGGNSLISGAAKALQGGFGPSPE